VCVCVCVYVDKFASKKTVYIGKVKVDLNTIFTSRSVQCSGEKAVRADKMFMVASKVHTYRYWS